MPPKTRTNLQQLPREMLHALRRFGVFPSRYVLCVNVGTQTMHLLERKQCARTSFYQKGGPNPGRRLTAIGAFTTATGMEGISAFFEKPPALQKNGGFMRFQIFPTLNATPLAFSLYRCRRRYRISTSAWGVGQDVDTDKTPLGLHRITKKVGGGHLIGTVFKSRKPVGLTWQGHADARIVHRILWLEGLEPGYNCGGNVDTFSRYIYIHGFGDETTLGRPNSHGCIHLAAQDLIPLHDLLPVGTLVWIAL